MPRNKGNSKAVRVWLLSTPSTMQQRKYYELEELYNMFTQDTTADTDKLSLNSFKIHINKCCNNICDFYKLQKSNRYEYKYIMLSKGERFYETMRVSSRRKSVTSPDTSLTHQSCTPTKIKAVPRQVSPTPSHSSHSLQSPISDITTLATRLLNPTPPQSPTQHDIVPTQTPSHVPSSPSLSISPPCPVISHLVSSIQKSILTQQQITISISSPNTTLTQSPTAPQQSSTILHRAVSQLVTSIHHSMNQQSSMASISQPITVVNSTPTPPPTPPKPSLSTQQSASTLDTTPTPAMTSGNNNESTNPSILIPKKTRMDSPMAFFVFSW